jgi:HSP20 family protein
MVRSLMNRNDRSLALTPLSRVFEQFFDEPFFGGPALTLMPVNRATQEGFALDLSENDQNLIVRATLPGFDKEDVNVEIDDGVLTISAEHNEEKTEGGENERFYRRERRFGSVQRRIQLPVPILENEAHADLSNGVLTLHLPKVQKAPARKISVGQRPATIPTQTGDATQPQGGTQPRSEPKGKPGACCS